MPSESKFQTAFLQKIQKKSDRLYLQKSGRFFCEFWQFRQKSAYFKQGFGSGLSYNKRHQTYRFGERYEIIRFKSCAYP
ncbi:hypothetical protein [Moraxella marmotae]|uniref:hypothetical protein n=1 Tax=Moraxella marmotae TaxID=3344520 RepID=UPI0035D43717